jgi:hypothetical protein
MIGPVESVKGPSKNASKFVDNRPDPVDIRGRVWRNGEASMRSGWGSSTAPAGSSPADRPSAGRFPTVAARLSAAIRRAPPNGG